MANTTAPILESLKFTDMIMNLVTSDLTNDVATRRSRDDAGASMAWIIGHLCHYRYEIAKLLGAKAESPFAEMFGNAAATDGSNYPDLTELKANWTDTSALVLAAVEAATDEQIMSPLGGKDSPHDEQLVLNTLVFYMWHESYHMGQFGTLRAQFGLTPTATLAMEASQQSA